LSPAHTFNAGHIPQDSGYRKVIDRQGGGLNAKPAIRMNSVFQPRDFHMNELRNRRPSISKGRKAKLADPNDYGKEAMKRLQKQFGGKFGAANKGRSLSASEIEDWKLQNGLLN
jgi:hypothetical protein